VAMSSKLTPSCLPTCWAVEIVMYTDLVLPCQFVPMEADGCQRYDKSTMTRK
jgi:hypothetical protein